MRLKLDKWIWGLSLLVLTYACKIRSDQAVVKGTGAKGAIGGMQICDKTLKDMKRRPVRKAAAFSLATRDGGLGDAAFMVMLTGAAGRKKVNNVGDPLELTRGDTFNSGLIHNARQNVLLGQGLTVEGKPVGLSAFKQFFLEGMVGEKLPDVVTFLESTVLEAGVPETTREGFKPVLHSTDGLMIEWLMEQSGIPVELHARLLRIRAANVANQMRDIPTMDVSKFVTILSGTLEALSGLGMDDTNRLTLMDLLGLDLREILGESASVLILGGGGSMAPVNIRVTSRSSFVDHVRSGIVTQGFESRLARFAELPAKLPELKLEGPENREARARVRSEMFRRIARGARL